MYEASRRREERVRSRPKRLSRSSVGRAKFSRIAHPAEHRIQTTLARHVRDVVVGRVGRRADDHLAAVGVADDLALRLDPAAQRLEEGVAAVALEAGQADELACLDLEVDRPCVGAEPERADAEHRRTAPVRDRLQPVLLAADERLGSRHQAYQLLRRPLPAVELGHAHAGSHHGDPVADLLDLVHAMGDEDHADAAPREVAHDCEQPVARGDVERGGGLVEDEDLGLAHERAHDPARLTIRQRELLDGHAEVDLAAEQLAQHLPGARDLVALRDARAPRVVGAEPDVVEHRARLGDEDLLEGGEDAAASERRAAS